ncbi:hypothetical protein EDD22DRAFT_912777 [Suillus occidentalis]|nr:hypothetical protein EDD22DRAFT_912777 [Suillus occidentalis]
MINNATRRPPIQARRIPQGFFDGVQNYAQSSATRGTHSRPRSTQAPLLDRFASLFCHPHADEAIELQQRPTRPIFSQRLPTVEVPAVRDKQVCAPSSVLLIIVQSSPVSHCLLPAGQNVTRRHRHSNSNLNRKARDPQQHPMLQALMLLRRVVLAPIYNQHNCKDTHRPNPRLRRHHHRLSLPFPPRPRPRRLLLLMLILPHQVQQACSHAPCHCGPVSFFFSAVHLSRMQTDISTASSARISHL